MTHTDARRVIATALARLAPEDQRVYDDAMSALEAIAPAVPPEPRPRWQRVPCQWYAGDCPEEGDPDLDGLCPFHFDATEREPHFTSQREHDRARKAEDRARLARLEASLHDPLFRYRRAR